MAPAMQATQAATQAATQGSAEPGPAEAAEPEAPTRWPLVAPTSETVRHKGAGARKSEWAACDRCNKWRRLPRSVAASSLPDPWYCEMNTWDEQRNRCEVAEERLRYGDGNEQDDLSVIPTVAPDGTQLVMSADSATGYKGVALSSGGKRSRDEAAALPDTAAYRVEYALDKDGNLAPKGAGVRNTRYFASCLEAATWHAASPRAPCSTRACTRACRALLAPPTPPPRRRYAKELHPLWLQAEEARHARRAGEAAEREAARRARQAEAEARREEAEARRQAARLAKLAACAKDAAEQLRGGGGGKGGGGKGGGGKGGGRGGGGKASAAAAATTALVPAGSHEGLPPGWHEERRARASGGSYVVVHGPGGARAASKAEAWRRHSAAAGEGVQLRLPRRKSATGYEGPGTPAVRALPCFISQGEGVARDRRVMAHGARSFHPGQVRAALEAIGLGQYAPALEALGYGEPACMPYLKTLGPQRLREIGLQAGMKPGHASKFADLLFSRS